MHVAALLVSPPPRANTDVGNANSTTRFFSSPRGGEAVSAGGLGDFLVVSNFAVTPQMRIAQMTKAASLFPGNAMQVQTAHAQSQAPKHTP